MAEQKPKPPSFRAVILLILLPVAFFSLLLFKREPSYNGRPASYWLREKLRPLEPSEGLEALQHLGNKSIPTFEKALKSSTPNERYKAAWTLGEMGSVARESVPSLIQALEDTNNSVRYYSIQSLAKIDSSGAEMIPALVKSLRDSNKSVSAAAAEVLSQMEQDRKMKNLPPFYTNEFEYAMAFVTSVSPQVQIMGIEKLGALQGYDQDVSSALKELSESTNTSVRMQAELALKTK